MKEYFGSSSKLYQQTGGKQQILIPAIMKQIPSVHSSKSNLLDLACGNGDFNPLVVQKGYSYFGLDISSDMLIRAEQNYPNGNYLLSSATDFSSKMDATFDVIVISMLFPAFSKKEDIKKVLDESKKVLNENGRIIIGISHPLYDCYMRKGLFDVDYVETEFSGYFTSGESFLIHKKFDNGVMTFEDYHWLLSDYIDCINASNLRLVTIDECEPVGGSKEFLKEKKRYPTYMVITCERGL